MMLVHHDDAAREWAYGAESQIGTFSDALITEAKKRDWVVISMKNDWNRIFAFDISEGTLSMESTDSAQMEIPYCLLGGWSPIAAQRRRICTIRARFISSVSTVARPTTVLPRTRPPSELQRK
jgi:hypothetical protein